jgi:uncharacterized membrane protein
MNDRLAAAAGLGAVTGLRSMTALAALSRELSDRRRLPRTATRLEAWLAEDTVAIALSGLALGELVADKFPGIPDRVSPGPLFGRALIGALVGAVAAGGEDRALGVVVGGGAAVVAAYVGWLARREAGRASLLPDAVFALAEDAVAVSSARELVAEL